MSSPADYATIAAAARTLDVELSQDVFRLLERYAALVREWNERFNLVSRNDVPRVLPYHVIDSIAVARFIPAAARCGDIGTGGGLPGIPLAVVRPDIKVILVESSQKKGLFLNAAIDELGIPNVELVNARAESLPPLACDAITSRLTGPLLDVVGYAAIHLAPQGHLMLYKTTSSRAELHKAARRIARLHLRLVETRDVVLPITGIVRRFVTFSRS